MLMYEGFLDRFIDKKDELIKSVIFFIESNSDIKCDITKLSNRIVISSYNLLNHSNKELMTFDKKYYIDDGEYTFFATLVHKELPLNISKFLVTAFGSKWNNDAMNLDIFRQIDFKLNKKDIPSIIKKLSAENHKEFLIDVEAEKYNL